MWWMHFAVHSLRLKANRSDSNGDGIRAYSPFGPGSSSSETEFMQ